MNSKRLTRSEALLVQRYVDGECDDEQRMDAEELLDDSKPARIYASALESLGDAVRIAEEEAWERASLASSQEVMELIEQSADFSDAPLEELAPMLERFHDGEVADVEAAVVAALVDERADVADYLAELDRLGDGIRSAADVEDVDFDGFWEGIEAGIDAVDEEKRDDESATAAPVAVEAFDPDEHRRVLYRYHDGEATPGERRRVEAWLESGDERVDAILGALAEVHVGVNAGIELAVGEADLDDIRRGVDDRLDALDAERAADNVVALGDRSQTPATWKKPVAAVAAAVALLAIGAWIGPQVFDQPGEVETETVVIFDTIESAPGSSVMVHSPQLADHDISGDNGLTPNAGEDAIQPAIKSEDDEADPTILWVVDDDNGEDDDDDTEPEDEWPDPI